MAGFVLYGLLVLTSRAKLGGSSGFSDCSVMPSPGGVLYCYELPEFVFEGGMDAEDPAVAAYSAKVNKHVPVNVLEAWDGKTRKGEPGDYEEITRTWKAEDVFPDEQHWDDGPDAASDEEPEDDEDEGEPSGEDLEQDDVVPMNLVRNQPRNTGYKSVFEDRFDADVAHEAWPGDEPACMSIRLVDYFGDTDPVDQIRECRTYASYVTQELKRKKQMAAVQRRKPGPYSKKAASSKKKKTTKRSRLE